MINPNMKYTLKSFAYIIGIDPHVFFVFFFSFR